jgi:hypothetical protein
MSVVVQCYHCSAILELDDGFRGGVCRCSSCGSLLQVPRGEDGVPSGKKVRPATPPSPISPTTPVQNATSSKLDVGLSRGQFEQPPSPQSRRQDIGTSSGLGRVHQTTPIAPSSKHRRRSERPGATAQSAAVDAQRSRAIFWLGLLLALLITAMLALLVVYYIYYYEPPMPLPMPVPTTH